MNTKALKWINTVALAVTLAANALANLIPLGIGTTGAVSEKYENLFTPAPYTFGVWGVIYVFMVLYVLYGWGVFDNGRRSAEVLHRIGLWFALTCVFNTAWVFAWHYDVIGLSVILIAALLVTLIIITRLTLNDGAEGIEKFSVNYGFSIYYGWIVAALISNISVYLVKLGWNGFGLSESFWTCVVLAVGAVIGTLIALSDGTYLPTLTVIWAYVGIIVKHAGEKGYGGQYLAVIITAVFSIAVMSIGLFAAFMTNREEKEARLSPAE